MKASQLIGKEVIRTRPCDYQNGHYDYSFCTTPIKIVKATDYHIFYQYSEWIENYPVME